MQVIKHATHFEVIAHTSDEEDRLEWLLNNLAESTSRVVEGAAQVDPKIPSSSH